MSVIEDSSLKTDASTRMKSLISSNEGIADRAEGIASVNQKALGGKTFRRMTDGATNSISSTADNVSEVAALRAHLETAQPFNGKWQIKEFINSGAYGSVIAVEYIRDDRTKLDAVLKISVGDCGNRQAEWEAFILRRIQEKDENANVVRLLDNGTLANWDERSLKFLAVEKCELSIEQYLKDRKGIERRNRVCVVVMGLLKSIYDIHKLGILHRDLKAMNAGLIEDSDGNIKVLLYDFGNARLFTEDTGTILPPRTTTQYRGSKEFSSNWADDFRDQTRWDDLISWFYVAIDLMNPNENSEENPLPWSRSRHLKHKRSMTFLKGPFLPANVLLRHCPPEFYAINSYLMTAPRHSTPDYGWLLKKIREAKNSAV